MSKTFLLSPGTLGALEEGVELGVEAGFEGPFAPADEYNLSLIACKISLHCSKN